MSPELGVVNRASPCSAKWAEMTGDERARLCARCKRHVYKVAELPPEEARALVHATEGSHPVRYWARADGTALTHDCPVGVRAKRLRRAGALIALLVLAIVSTAAVKLGLRVGWGRNGPLLYQDTDALRCPGSEDLVMRPSSPPKPPARPPGRPPLPPLPEFRE